MKCRRCSGALVSEWLIDILDETGQIQCNGWRCINCGNIEEAVILSHQLASLSASSMTRPRPLRGRARLRHASAKSLARV